MKRVLFYGAIALSTLQAYAESQETVNAVHKQQQTFVTGLIKHCKDRLPLVADAQVVRKGAIVALDELSSFLNMHPDALECVIDTFKTCIHEKCTDVPSRVNECIQSYQDSAKAIASSDTQLLQTKVNDLVVSYFNFQLTLLGKIDHYTQEFLYKTNLAPYLELAKPAITFVAVYAAINGSLLLLDKLLTSCGATDSNDQTSFKKLPKMEAIELSDNNNIAALIDTLNKFITTVENTIPKAIKPKTNSTLAGSLKTFASGVLKELDSSIITKAVAASFLVPNAREATDKAYKYTRENWEKNYASAVGKARKSGYPAKPSKESFDTIKGYNETKLAMTPVIDFCFNLEKYRAADLKLARGYLFEGSLADGRKMAQALAGEMSKKFEDIGSPAKWLVYEIHGSSLVNKNLKRALDECLEFGPTVLIINNIDWIYAQKDVEADVYADIINVLAKYLSQESNFPVLVCATSQDHTIIDPVMLEAHKFEVVKLA